MEYSPTERIGVNATEAIFLKEFAWIFRDQPVVDMGIDAHVEVVLKDGPTGQLIALQIKTGESHFEIKDDHLVYYGNNKHLDYWVNHSLPVLIIAHLPEEGKTYWEVVQGSKVERTKKAWKISIPKSQELSKKHYDALSKLGSGTPEMKKRRKLFMDKALMEVIQNGGAVCVEFDEWLHKSLNRTNVKVLVKVKGKKEYVHKVWGIAYAGYQNEEMLQLNFPWADAKIDEEYYEMNMDEDSLRGMYDLKILYKKAVYPYVVHSDEVASFRVALSLNRLGDSFLTYLDFVENGEMFEE